MMILVPETERGKEEEVGACEQQRGSKKFNLMKKQTERNAGKPAKHVSALAYKRYSFVSYLEFLPRHFPHRKRNAKCSRSFSRALRQSTKTFFTCVRIEFPFSGPSNSQKAKGEERVPATAPEMVSALCKRILFEI